jgi:AraC-like DNA-binding protein
MADESMTLAGRVAVRIADDRRLTRVEQLVDEFGVGLRQLQRLFSEYVGISPKWVIQGYRLLEAAERVPTRAHTIWPELALDLAYADQAHFIRD